MFGKITKGLIVMYDGLITKPPIDELYHHGIKGQKWGVKNGPPYPLKESSASEKIYRNAEQRVDEISKDVIAAAKHAGSKMYGLEHRLKTKDSISRKINKKSKEDKQSISKSANDIKDAIRFTTISSNDSFVSSYQKVKKELENKGYVETRCKNYFDLFNQGRVKHKSVQSNYKTKDGYEFEIQFQTPESQDAKNKKIPLYEERRSLNVSKKRANELEKMMEDLALKVPDPYDIHKIKSH